MRKLFVLMSRVCVVCLLLYPMDGIAKDTIEPRHRSSESVMHKNQKADASIDRNILMSSAETVGAGKISYNNYQILLSGLTYGINKTSQVSVTILKPVFAEIPLVLLANGKFKVFQNKTTIVSVQPQFFVVSKDGFTAGAFGLSAMADIVLDSKGTTTFSTSLATNFAFGSNDNESGGTVSIGGASNGGAIFLFSTGINTRLGSSVKLLTEVVLPSTYVWASGQDRFDVWPQGLLFNYGLRFFGRGLAVDLTFLRPMHPDIQDELVKTLPMGYPYLAFSARF